MFISDAYFPALCVEMGLFLPSHAALLSHVFREITHLILDIADAITLWEKMESEFAFYGSDTISFAFYSSETIY